MEIKVPEIGESISEAELVEWLVEDGATVDADEPLCELETDKVTLALPAPAAGVLRIVVSVGETVKIGQTVATLESAGASVAASPAQSEGEPPAPPAGIEQLRARSQVDIGELAPAVRRLVAEHGLDPVKIPATGKDGRLTKADVLSYMGESGASAPVAAPATPSPAPPAPEAARPTPPAKPAPAGSVADPAGRQSRKRMSALRHRVAERLLASQQGTATLTTFNQVDMSKVIELRKRHKDNFEKKFGVRLGFMSFFVKATVHALQSMPNVNVFIDGGDIVTNHYYDIGVAVSSDRGLVVPVLRDADKLSLAAIEAGIGDLAARTKQRKLELHELMGGVFTISNGGVFGSLLSTPILNPPQSAVLGMHAIEKRPVVVDDEIVIRPMMYLALSYDHRLIDGREAVTFLRRIIECVQEPEKMLLEVCDGNS